MNPRFQELPYYAFLAWLLLAGLVVFGVVVAWQEGLMLLLWQGDQSRISLGIALLFLAGSVHALRRVLFLSAELELAADAQTRLATLPAGTACLVEHERLSFGNGLQLPECVAVRFVADSWQHRVDGHTDGEQPRLEELLAERLKGSHELGWFMVDLLIKLGLIGTIVGFIFMLGSVAETASLDVNTMQKVLRQMSAGMGTALYTTLAGLVCSILLGIQYILIDRTADDLIARAVAMAQLGVQPALRAAAAAVP